MRYKQLVILILKPKRHKRFFVRLKFFFGALWESTLPYHYLFLPYLPPPEGIEPHGLGSLRSRLKQYQERVSQGIVIELTDEMLFGDKGHEYLKNGVILISPRYLKKPRIDFEETFVCDCSHPE